MQDSIMVGVQNAWALTLVFLPKFALFLIVLVVGYFVAKWLGKLVSSILRRVGFDRLVERGGIRTALAKARLDASDIMSKIVFYALFLFVLQLAFGVFAPNPVSDILNRVILFLPSLFVSLLIVIVASAIAKAAKELLQVAFAGLSYGRLLANIAAAAIVIVGIFAALSHLQIAPAIVNGLFYAALAIVAGSAIIAIGGGGIIPMRARWERALGKMEAEVPKLKAATSGSAERIQGRAEEWKETAKSEIETAQAGQGGTASSRISTEATGISQVPRYEPKERSKQR